MSDTPREHPTDHADIGVFGGSGFYSFLDDVTTHQIDTPYGPTAAPVAIGRLGERTVAFIPRHGANHEFAPTAPAVEVGAEPLAVASCLACTTRSSTRSTTPSRPSR